jgi:hypothetical protein
MRSRLAPRKRLVALIADLRSENWRLEGEVRRLRLERDVAVERTALVEARAAKWERIAAERRNWINPALKTSARPQEYHD